MKRSLAVGLMLAGLFVLCGCGGGDDTAASGPPKNAPRARILPPQVLFQAQPDLSDADAEALWATAGRVRAELLVNVGRDGVASNARVVAAEPKGQPVAQAFAEAVMRSIPRWKFQPATRDGVPVDAEMTLTMEAEGGASDPSQH